MTWTTDDLAELEKGIREGAREVEYKDKKVVYRSLREMLVTRDIMRQELGLIEPSPRRTYGTSTKGL